MSGDGTSPRSFLLLSFLCLYLRGLPANRPKRSVEYTMPEPSGLISFSHGLDVVTFTTGAALIWTGVQFYLEPQSCSFTNLLSNVWSWWLIFLSRRVLWPCQSLRRRTHRFSIRDGSKCWCWPFHLHHDLPRREKRFRNIPSVLDYGGHRG